MSDGSGENRPENWTGLIVPILMEAWQVARGKILNAGLMSADRDMWMLSNPDQLGDPAQQVDQYMHQWIAGRLSQSIPTIQVVGEESVPSSMLLDRDVFRDIASVDAIDGSRQAFSLPGCWSSNIVVQRYLGPGEDGDPTCSVLFIGLVDAEGVTVTWEPSQPFVEIAIAGGMGSPDLVSDQLLVGDAGTSGITGVTTILAGGYKPASWKAFEVLRGRLPDCPAFNTAGAPVTRKALQNSDVVVVQLAASSLWDGVGAGLIAAAGGFVVPLGSREPLATKHVIDWFSAFGYQRRHGASDRLTERMCVPAFAAGMDFDRVLRVAAAATDLTELDS